MNSYDPQSEIVLTGEVFADIQPYNGALASKEYGIETACQKRIYAEPCKHIKEGDTVVVESTGEKYKIAYAEHWDDYTMALLNNISKGVYYGN